MPDSEGIVGWKLELGEVGTNAGGRKADVLEDSLPELELNDDRRLSTSVTSLSVNLLADFSLSFLTLLSIPVVAETVQLKLLQFTHNQGWYSNILL